MNYFIQHHWALICDATTAFLPCSQNSRGFYVIAIVTTRVRKLSFAKSPKLVYFRLATVLFLGELKVPTIFSSAVVTDTRKLFLLLVAFSASLRIRFS